MASRFSMIPKVKVERSKFDRSHGYKTTLDENWIVPFFVDEVLPGDTFSISANLFCRLATPITPFMDNVYVDTFWFFVPNRLVWENWQRFMGERDDPDDSIDFTIPQVEVTLGPWKWIDNMEDAE